MTDLKITVHVTCLIAAVSLLTAAIPMEALAQTAATESKQPETKPPEIKQPESIPPEKCCCSDPCQPKPAQPKVRLALSSDRPLHTLSGALVGQWVFQFESGFDFAQTGNSSNHVVHSTAPSELRLGVHERMEIFAFTYAFVTDIYTSTGKDSTYGFHDIEAGMKFSFTPGGGLWGLEPSSTLYVSIIIPVGNDGFSIETYSPKAVLALSWKLPSYFLLSANIGTQLLENKDGNKFFQGLYGVSLQRSWAPLTTVVGNFVEFYGDLAFSPSAFNNLIINGGFYFLVNENFRVDLSVRGGMVGPAPGIAGAIGVAIRI